MPPAIASSPVTPVTDDGLSDRADSSGEGSVARPRPVADHLWTVRPRFGAAGGPLEHALTNAGDDLAFAVGAKIRPGPACEALSELAARGGRAILYKEVGGRLLAQPLARFDAVVWGFLSVRGLIERFRLHGAVVGDGVRLTGKGRQAVDDGHGEQRRLLKRVCRAHPLEEADAPD